MFSANNSPGPEHFNSPDTFSFSMPKSMPMRHHSLLDNCDQTIALHVGFKHFHEISSHSSGLMLQSTTPSSKETSEWCGKWRLAGAPIKPHTSPCPYHTSNLRLVIPMVWSPVNALSTQAPIQRQWEHVPGKSTLRHKRFLDGGVPPN